MTMTSTYLFAGLFNAFLYDFYLFSYPCFLIPTALLICIENTFWNINGDGNFVKLFKKSFTLYVKSGRREMTERGIDLEILRNDWDLDLDSSFNSTLYKFIVDHYLRKFHCFYLHLTYLELSSPTKYSQTWGRKEWKRDYMASEVGAKILGTKGMSCMMGWWGLNFVRSWIVDKPLRRDAVVKRHPMPENLHLYWLLNIVLYLEIVDFWSVRFFCLCQYP